MKSVADKSALQLVHLPIDDFIPTILESLKKHNNLVLTAAPGAGKTTRFPPALIRSEILSSSNPLAVMLEPRRLAARAAAYRIATEQNWTLGNEVGYQVRFENKTKSSTPLQIVTEGIFAQRLQSNPDLNGIGAIILDEFHERSAQTDVAIAMARELQELSRPDLKIIVMSATLETEKLCKFLGDCPVVDVPGQLFPLKTFWQTAPQTLVTGPEFYTRVTDTIHSLVSGKQPSAGNILVFLPGAGEIARLRSELIAKNISLRIEELHGSLSLEKQSDVLSTKPERRIILATNIAESSLTVPGVATVVDTGLAKVLRQDGNSFAQLHLSRISQFSAIQRAGRAGREREGYSYRLWSKQDEASMPQSELPELLRTDVSDTVLLLSHLGVSDPSTFTWYEQPSARSLKTARDFLFRVGAVSSSGQITEFGRRLLRWPINTRLAVLLLKSVELKCAGLGSRIAALLSEKDPFSDEQLRGFSQTDSDLLARLDAMEQFGMPEYLRRAETQLQEVAKKFGASIERHFDYELIPELLVSAFPDRLARRRKAKEPRAKLITGTGVTVHSQSLTKKCDLFVCLDATSPRSGSTELVVTKASPIPVELLETKFPDKIRKVSRTVLDEESGQAITEEYASLEELPLEEPKRRGATAAEATSLLPQFVVRKWDEIINSHPDAKNWIQRLEFARKYCSELQWPPLDDEFKRRVAEAISIGEKSLTDIRSKSLTIYLELELGADLTRELNSQFPKGFTIPSGRFVEVDYSEQPTIEARLQEFFGWMDSPTLANGKIKVRVQLLGPNYRPVQVTSDLKGFWSSSYHEVRKELRARYPKHDWPENPLESVAKPRKI